MTPYFLLTLFCAIPGASTEPTTNPQATSADPDEKMVRQAGYNDDPAGLLRLVADYTRTEMPISAAAVDRLFVQLGTESFDEREQASRELVALGRPVLPRLRRLAHHADPEIARRARLAREEIESKLSVSTVQAAARLLIRRKVPGAAGALLAYLPDTDPAGMEEVLSGLVSLGRAAGRLDPALAAALADPCVDRRAAAALTLGGQVRSPEERALLTKARVDSEPIVRLRAAQGLLASRDDTAVPLLLDLLGAPVEIAWQAEELLCWLAGPDANRPPLGKGGMLPRAVCRAAWASWWRAAGPKVDWERVAADHRRPGLMLLCGHHQVWMSGCDGRERWSVSVSGRLVDAQLLPGPRILLADTNNGRVLEIDLNGNEIWSYGFFRGEVVQNCQRLPGGNTFIGTDDYLIEVAPDGRTVWTYRPTGGDLLCDAYRCGDRIVAVEGRHLVELTVGGGFRRLPTRLGSVTSRVLPWGKEYLVVDMNQDQVLHVDVEARMIDSVSLPGISSLEMLSGDTLLAASYGELERRGGWHVGRVFEMTMAGRVLQEALTPRDPDVALFRFPCRARSCLRLVRIGLNQARPEGLNLDTIAYRMKCMKNSRVEIRCWSAVALGKFGVDGGQAIDTLVDALADPDGDVRKYSGISLKQIGVRAVDPLRAALRSRPERVRVEAAVVLSNFGNEGAPAVPELRAALMEARAGVELRCQSAAALGWIGPAAADAVPDLIAALKTARNPDILRCKAAQALGAIGQATPPVVSALVAALEDQSVRISAAAALGSLGPPAAAAVPHLVKLLPSAADRTTNDNKLREEIAYALGKMGHAAAPAVPVLAALVKDAKEDADLRTMAVQALAWLGDTARPAVPVLAEVLLQQELPQPLAIMAAQFLSIQDEAGMAGLIAATRGGNPTTRPLVMTVLGEMGAEAKPALPALREAANDKDGSLSTIAKRAITRIEAASAPKP